MLYVMLLIIFVQVRCDECYTYQQSSDCVRSSSPTRIFGTKTYINMSQHLGIKRQASAMTVLKQQLRISTGGCMYPLTAKGVSPLLERYHFCVVMTRCYLDIGN